MYQGWGGGGWGQPVYDRVLEFIILFYFFPYFKVTLQHTNNLKSGPNGLPGPVGYQKICWLVGGYWTPVGPCLKCETFCKLLNSQPHTSQIWMEISAIKGGEVVQRLMANAIKNVLIFLYLNSNAKMNRSSIAS